MNRVQKGILDPWKITTATLDNNICFNRPSTLNQTLFVFQVFAFLWKIVQIVLGNIEQGVTCDSMLFPNCLVIIGHFDPYFIICSRITLYPCFFPNCLAI